MADQRIRPPYYVLAFAMAIPAVLVGLQVPLWVRYIPSLTIERQADFRAFYGAGYMARTGDRHELYQYQKVREVQDLIVARDGGAMPFIHPAYEAALFIPLSSLPFRWAYLAWVVVNIGLLLIIYKLLKPKMACFAEIAAWMPFALLLAFVPIPWTILEGQDSLLLFIAVLLSMKQMERGFEFRSGLVLGVASFRFQFLLPIVLIFGAWAAWRFISGFALSAIASFTASTALVGLRAQWEYIKLLKLISTVPSLQPVSHMPNLRGFLSGVGLNSPLLLLACSVLIFGAASYAGRKVNPETRWCIAIVTSALVSYHFLLHDMSVVFIPLILVCLRLLSEEKWLSLFGAAIVLAIPEVVVIFGQDSAFISAFSSLLLLGWFLAVSFYRPIVSQISLQFYLH